MIYSGLWARRRRLSLSQERIGIHLQEELCWRERCRRRRYHPPQLDDYSLAENKGAGQVSLLQSIC